MEFQDKTLKCKDCGQDFLFTTGEQDFYRQKSLQNEPGRCPECRNKRKQQAGLNNLVSASAPDAPPITIRQVSKVVCAECGKETTVPFRPRQSRPVYCSECFNKQRAKQSTLIEAEAS